MSTPTYFGVAEDVRATIDTTTLGDALTHLRSAHPQDLQDITSKSLGVKLKFYGADKSYSRDCFTLFFVLEPRTQTLCIDYPQGVGRKRVSLDHFEDLKYATSYMVLGYKWNFADLPQHKGRLHSVKKVTSNEECI